MGYSIVRLFLTPCFLMDMGTMDSSGGLVHQLRLVRSVICVGLIRLPFRFQFLHWYEVSQSDSVRVYFALLEFHWGVYLS